MKTRRGFKGRTVVITGAAGGLGDAFARRWAAAGARLGLLDLNGDAVAALAEDLTAQGAQCLGLACDITDQASVDAAIGEIASTLGPVYGLINNAGITQRSAMAETSAEVYRRVMDVNFFGSLYCTLAALPDLMAQRGIIVVISSIAGFAPLLGRSGYCAAKHALHGLFDSLRAETLGSGLDVTVVCPSFVDTAIARSALGGDGSITDHPQSTTGRVATPQEVAGQVFLAASRGKRLLVLSTAGRVSRIATRLVPGLYEKMMARALASELRR